MELDNEKHSAVLFKNNKTKDNQPDYKGWISVKKEKEKLMEVSGWINQSASGVTYMSISFSKPFKKQENKQPTFIIRSEIIDDELPF